MANRQHWPMQASTNDSKIVYGSFVGNGVASPTVVGGDVVSVTRTGVGLLTIALRHPYVSTLFPNVRSIGPTKLDAKLLTFNPVTQTMTVELQAGAAVATDATSSDTIYLALNLKNSGI